MTDYDSDDSMSDAASDIETSVLLGYASKDPVPHSDPFNHLGGSPTWLDNAQHCPPTLVQCPTCNDFMTLLLQLNGDLPIRNGATQFLGHERRLYIWACKRKACRRKTGSVRAVRAVRVSKTLEEQDRKQEAEQGPKRDIGGSLFGGGVALGAGGSNPFASSSSSGNPFATSSSSNPFANTSNPFSSASTSQSTTNAKMEHTAIDTLPQTFAQKARISATDVAASPSAPSTPPAPWPQASSLPLPYPHYHLDAAYEYLPPHTQKNSKSNISANHTAFLDSQPSESSSSSKDKDDDEKGTYESAHDRTFQHFADTLAANPEQILRYEFAGQPLLYSRNDDVGTLLTTAPQTTQNRGVTTTRAGAKGIPRCGNCGAGRLFEVQLTPQAIVELEQEEEVGLDGMEWATILVGTCEKDCGIAEDDKGSGKVRYLEEWCGVQWEELVRR